MSVVFTDANSKLERLAKVPELRTWLQNGRKIKAFNLLSGYSCPQANECLAKVQATPNPEKKSGLDLKVIDGENCQFRCFSATNEATYPSVYQSRKKNFDAIKACKTVGEMVKLIHDALPKNTGIVRIHVAGDFFNEKYFQAWCVVAQLNPETLFYAYTKSLNYWLDNQMQVPENFVLTASRGGRLDHLIDKHNLREAKVVFSTEEADALGYEIDHTDEHAAIPEYADKSFALLIHGKQPKGSKASAAIKSLKANNIEFSYSKKGSK